MARLPVPGSDDGKWGQILNEYLSQSLSDDGDLKPQTVGSEHIKAGAITPEMIGLENVDNTSDINKPISTAVANALGSKVNLSDFDATTADAIGDKTSATATVLANNFAPAGISQSAWVSFRPVFRKIAQASNVSRPVIRVVGLGSSVVASGGVSDVTTKGPLALFVQNIRKALDPQDRCDWEVYNYGVNGSTVDTGDTKYNEAKAAIGGNFDIAFLGYGMNDFNAYFWHKGLTFGRNYGTPGVACFLQQHQELLQLIKDDGCVPVTSTTPHRHNERVKALANGYGLAANQISEGILFPHAPTDPRADQNGCVYTPNGSPEDPHVKPYQLGDGTTIQEVDVRYIQGNAAIREQSGRLGVACLNAEAFWFYAKAKLGDDTLFDAGQYNHPNDLGIDSSYGAASRELARGIKDARILTTSEEIVDEPAPTSRWDIKKSIRENYVVATGGSTYTVTVPEESFGTLTVYSTSGDGNRSLLELRVISKVTEAKVVEIQRQFVGVTPVNFGTVTTSGLSINIPIVSNHGGGNVVHEYAYRLR